MMRVMSVIMFGILALSFLVYFIDDYSGGKISHWISLNLSGEDPSMVGHGNSFVQVWEVLDEYYLYGYPRGSVGPKALVQEADLKNVENGMLSIFYDMGIPLGIAFIVFSSLLLGCMYRHPSQIAVLVGFAVPAMFLPYVFSPDIIIFFLFIYSYSRSFNG
ncbi:MAG: hypothetical protein LBU76_01830 [Azoarcus sp.]|nr:hypothetical protein [Azoarcus sp.]